MRRFVQLLTITALLGYCVGLGSFRISAQQRQSASELFQKLRSFQTTDQVTDQLRDLAESNTIARQYLTDHLPAMIEAGPKHYHPSNPPDSAWQWPDPVWSNAVSLAADLRIVECAPALAKWISVRTSGMTSLPTEASLENSPAGTALIRIGDPAIPALQAVLQKGKAEERWEATHALLRIGSENAKMVLREHAAHESDESLRGFIEKTTSK